MPNITELLRDLDQKRAECEGLYARIEADLTEDKEVDDLIAGFESSIREYEKLQEAAFGELEKMEAELKAWGENARG